MTEEYSGWANRETWCLHLWLTNEEPLYRAATAVVRGIDDKYDAAVALEAWVLEWYVSFLHKTHDGLNMMMDIGSLWRVDWVSVAQALQEE